jgi:hypothetical protein
VAIAAPSGQPLHGLWRIRAYLHLLPGYDLILIGFPRATFAVAVSGAGQFDASQDEDAAVG